MALGVCFASVRLGARRTRWPVPGLGTAGWSHTPNFSDCSRSRRGSYMLLVIQLYGTCAVGDSRFPDRREPLLMFSAPAVCTLPLQGLYFYSSSCPLSDLFETNRVENISAAQVKCVFTRAAGGRITVLYPPSASSVSSAVALKNNLQSTSLRGNRRGRRGHRGVEAIDDFLRRSVGRCSRASLPLTAVAVVEAAICSSSFNSAGHVPLGV